MARCHDRRASSKPQEGFDLLKIEESFVASYRLLKRAEPELSPISLLAARYQCAWHREEEEG